MLRIMIVDDNKSMLVFIKDLMTKSFGENILFAMAKDGMQAKKQLEDFHPDLIITEIVMPNMDGIELIEYLSKRSDVPIIAITSSDDGSKMASNYLSIASALGADSAILKTDLSTGLSVVVKKLLE